MTTGNPDITVRSLEAHFLGRNDLINRWGNVKSSWGMLPGSVGFWSMANVQRSTGNVYDDSGQGRMLTYNGNPTFNTHNIFAPTVDLDGTGDYLSRADETDLDILGTETIYPSTRRGLTLGGWFLVSSVGVGTFPRLIGKENGAGARSYMLEGRESTSDFLFFVSSDGTATTTISGGSLVPGAWNFIVGRYRPSIEVALFVNGVKFSSTTSVPASIFNSSSAFTIGATGGGGSLLTGRASLCFLSANPLADVAISGLYDQSKVLFGV